METTKSSKVATHVTYPATAAEPPDFPNHASSGSLAYTITVTAGGKTIQFSRGQLHLII
jgi:hypothetical protein